MRTINSIIICTLGIILITIMPFIQGIGLDENEGLHSNQFGCTVFLNKQGFHYDLEKLENIGPNEMEIRIIEEDEQLGSTMGQYGELPLFLYRSHYNSELGVLIQEDVDRIKFSDRESNLTKMGLSISIMLPLHQEIENVTFLRRGIEIKEIMNYSNEIDQELRNMGYQKTTPYDSINAEALITYRIGDTHLSFSVTSEQDVMSIVKIYVDQPMDSIPGLSGEYFHEIITQLGIYDRDIFREWSEYIDVLVPIFISNFSLKIEEIDWGSAFEIELDWLMDKSIIIGIDNTDVDEISHHCIDDRMGDYGRIGHYDDAGASCFSWIPCYYISYNITLQFFNNFDSVYFNENDLPVRNDDGQRSNFIVKMIFPLIIFLICSLIATLLYGGIKRASLLNNIYRKRLFDEIKENPGVYFREIEKKTGFKIGNLSHHLNILEREEFIRSLQDGHHRRFYLFNEQIEMKIILTSIQQMVILIINKDPGISQINISRKIGKNKVIIHYHVQILKDIGIIQTERCGRETKCFLTSQGFEYALN